MPYWTMFSVSQNIYLILELYKRVNEVILINRNIFLKRIKSSLNSIYDNQKHF
jgi:hypothetical protein